MTVCIGAVSHTGEIVLASDQMISMMGGAVSADGTALKAHPLHQDWGALFSGDDIGMIPSLLAMIIERLQGQVKWEQAISAAFMSNILETAFQEERRRRAVEQYLSPLGLSLQALLEGKAGFGTADILIDRVQRCALNCDLLVFGHDNAGRPHLLHLSDPGAVRDYALVGYWAIGSGEYLALSALATRRHSRIASLAATIYNVCEAKFFAEAALGVGQTTFVIVQRPHQAVGLDPALLGKIRREWERVGRPRPPSEVLPELEQWTSALGPAVGTTQPQSGAPVGQQGQLPPTGESPSQPPSPESPEESHGF